MATPTFRAANSATTANGTSVVVTKPTGTASGDVLIANFSYSNIPGSDTITPPSGFTSIDAGADSTNVSCNVFYKVAGGSEPSTYTFGAASNAHLSVTLVAYSGADNTTPIGNHSNKDVSLSSSVSFTALSANTNAGIVILCAAARNTASSTTHITAAGTGQTVRSDVCSTTTAFIESAIIEGATVAAGGTPTINSATVSQSSTKGTVAFVLQGVIDQPPNAATLSSPSNGATGVSTTPTANFSTTDPDGDTVSYEVQIDTSSSFNSQSTDPFNQTSLNGTLWTQFTAGSATASYASGGATFTYPAASTSSTDADIETVSTYNLTGTMVSLNVTAVPSAATSADAALHVIAGSTANEVSWLYEGGTMFAQKVVASSRTNVFSIAYNATAHAYWAIRELGGTTFWQMSQDNATWITLHSEANPITLTTVNVDIAATCFQNETNPGTFQFNSFLIGSQYLLIDALSASGGHDAAQFTDVTNGADTDPFASGDSINFTVPGGEALTNGNTYFWRARGIDPSGSNTWGSWSSAFSFTVTAGGAPPGGTYTQTRIPNKNVGPMALRQNFKQPYYAPPVTPNPALSTLQEDFQFDDNIDVFKWANNGGAQIYVTDDGTTHWLNLASVLGGDYVSMNSIGLFSMVGSAMFTQLLNAGNQTITSWEVYPVLVQSSVNPNYQVTIRVTGGNVQAAQKTGGALTMLGSPVTYNSATMQWFRIRESGGTTFWEYSADCVSWTQLNSATNPIDYSAVQGAVQIGTWQAESSTTIAQIDNINVAPGGLQVTWAGFTWNKRVRLGASQFNNQFLPANVGTPDSNGYLTLSIDTSLGSPAGAEIFTQKKSFGYGTYLLTVGTEDDNLHLAVVMGGLFLFDFSSPPDYREIDVDEVRYFNGNPAQILKSHVWNNGGNAIFITNSTNEDPSPVHTHRLIWDSSGMRFDSFIGPDTTGTNYFSSFQNTHLPIQDGTERAHINLWVQNANSPNSVGPTTITLRNFQYYPNTPTYLPAVNMGNRNVGPMAMRKLARVPYYPISAVSISTIFTQNLTAGLSFTGSTNNAGTKSLSGVLSFSGSAIKAAIHSLPAANLTFTGKASKAAIKSESASLSFTGAISRSVTKALSGALTFTGAILRAATHGLSAAMSFTGSLAKAATRNVSSALTFTGASKKNAAKSEGASLSFTGVLGKSAVKVLSGALSFTGALARVAIHGLAATISFTGGLTKTATHSLNAGLSFTGSVLVGRLKVIALSASLSFTGSVTKQPLKSLAATLSIASPAGSVNVGYPTIGGSNATWGVNTSIVGDKFTGGPTSGSLQSISMYCAATSGTLNIQLAVYTATGTTFNLVGNTGPIAVTTTPQWYTASASGILNDTNGAYFIVVENSGTNFKRYYDSGAQGYYQLTGQTYGTWPSSFSGPTGPNFSQEWSMYFTYGGGSSGPIKQVSKALSGSLSFSGSVIRAVIHGLNAALSFTGTLAKSVTHLLSGALSFTGAVSAIKVHLISIAASLSFTGNTSKQITKNASASLTFTGAVKKSVTHGLSASVSFTGALAKSVARNVAASLSFTGSVTAIKTHLINLVAGLSFTGGTTRQASKSLSASVSFTGSMKKTITHGISAALSFTGKTVKQATHTIAAALNLSGAFTAAKVHFINLTASIGFTGSANKTATRNIGAQVSFTGSVKRQTVKAFSAGVSLAGSLTKAISRGLAATLSFTVTFQFMFTGAVQYLKAKLSGSSSSAAVRGDNLSENINSSDTIETMNTNSADVTIEGEDMDVTL